MLPGFLYSVETKFIGGYSQVMCFFFSNVLSGTNFVRKTNVLEYFKSECYIGLGCFSATTEDKTNKWDISVT